MAAVASDLFAQAVAGKLPWTAVATVGGAALEFGGKFLPRHGDATTTGAWVSPATGADVSPRMFEQVVAERAVVRVTFCVDGSRAQCVTTATRWEKHHWLTDAMVVPALLLAEPDAVEQTDVRNARRHRLSDSAGGVFGKLFAVRPTRAELAATLWDLSSGGASFVVPTDKRLMTATPGEPFMAVLNFRGKHVVLPARLAHVRGISTRTMRLGIRFDRSLTSHLPAFDELEKIVDELADRRK